MSKVTLVNDDGSTVDFLDPAGVQAAVDAAIAALPAPTPVEGEVVATVEVENTDGSSENFVPETPVETAA